MNDVRELKPELDLIDIKRTSLMPAPEREEPKQITGREYRRTLRKWALAFGVSLGINIAQAIMIYVLQAGPI